MDPSWRHSRFYKTPAFGKTAQRKGHENPPLSSTQERRLPCCTSVVQQTRCAPYFGAISDIYWNGTS